MSVPAAAGETAGDGDGGAPPDSAEAPAARALLYGEPLRDDIMRSAIEYIRQADMLIVGGTSLSVYPAAGLIDHYRGGKLVLINRTATNADGRAALCIRESAVVDIVGKVLTPLLLAGLAAIIIKGVVTPLGTIAPEAKIDSAVVTGVKAGYQTTAQVQVLVVPEPVGEQQ